MPIGELLSNLIAGIIGSWLSDMIGVAIVAGSILFYLSRWLRKKHGKDESVFGDLIFSSLAIAGLALMFAAGVYARQQFVPVNEQHSQPIAQSINPYPEFILTGAFYLKKSKENIAEILDKVSDELNHQAQEILELAKKSTEGFTWTDPKINLDPQLDRIKKHRDASSRF